MASGAALLFYTALAFLHFWQVWSAPGQRSLGSSADPQQMMWFLGWTRFALSHQDNPLFTAFLDYPHGVNLMWNTSVLLPGVLLAPVTAWQGPVVAYNLLIALSLPLSAWCAYVAPGSSFVVLPTYLLIRGAAALAVAGRPDDAAMLQALTFTAAALPTVVLALLLLHFLRPLVREWWALAMALGYALGTIAFPFSTVYFGHTAAACLLFAAFYVLWRARPDGPAWQPLLAGFLAGWAVLVEFTAVLGAGPLLIYGLACSRRVLLSMGAGALLPAVLLLSYNWVSFGAPLHFGYSHETNPRFAVAMNRGLFGATWPRPLVLHDILLGPHGLLRLSPWLAIAPTGLLALRRPQIRREVMLCATIVLAFLLFNAGYYLPLGGRYTGCDTPASHGR